MLWMASRSIVPRRSGRASEFVRPPLPGQGLAPSRTLAGPMPFALCSRSRGVFAIGLLAALAPATAGCMVFQRISGSDTVDLSRARISTMNVEVRRESKTICPREPVQMAVFLTATKEGETKEQLFETWAGRTNVNKNDKLDFSQFAFQSEQGQFDKDGWFTPTPNLVATTGHEFLIRATFTPQPVVLSSVYKFRPDYACILAAGTSGLAGTVGGSGVAGTPGKPGSFGGVMSAGDAGGDGSSGMPGADGGNGGVGPHVHAVVTYVKTPFYDRLIAVRVTGTVDDLLLIHPGRPFVLRALGGEGGPGGLGGAGGAGGMGAGGNPGGPGGNAGRGGNGGRGGPGGPGGVLDLVYDARFPDLASAIRLDVSGGAGGLGGQPGPGGEPGRGGAGLVPANTPTDPHEGLKGHAAPPGEPGAVGRVGPPGTATAHPGPIGTAFSGLADVAVLSAAPAAPAAAPAR